VDPNAPYFTATPSATETPTVAIIDTPTAVPTIPETATESPTPTPTATATPPPPTATITPTVCPGDCDGDGTVNVSELIRAVNIALGLAAVDECLISDLDRNGEVTVNELIRAVNTALAGCS